MVERILFGVRGASRGLYVSIPGKNVITAQPNELLLSTDAVRVFQYVTQGKIYPTGSTGSYDIAIPNLGFRPGVIWTVSPNWENTQQLFGFDFNMTYISPTIIRVNYYNGSLITMSYGVTNLPITGF